MYPDCERSKGRKAATKKHKQNHLKLEGENELSKKSKQVNFAKRLRKNSQLLNFNLASIWYF